MHTCYYLLMHAMFPLLQALGVHHGGGGAAVLRLW